MSIYGIGNSNIPRTPAQLPVRDSTRPQVQQPTTPPVAIPTKPAVSSAPKTTTSVPAEAPEGTDPALWSVLSGEERAFFAKAGAMGPLTYGRALREMTGAQPPAARGGRLDVKG
jgi:hypothetical protein